MSGIVTRIVSEGSHISRHLLGVRSAPLKEYSAGFKVKAHLKLRCRSCYFVRVNGRLHVECNEYGRHRSREVFDVKALW